MMIDNLCGEWNIIAGCQLYIVHKPTQQIWNISLEKKQAGNLLKFGKLTQDQRLLGSDQELAVMVSYKAA